jgi:hypothetical protein
LFGGELGDPEIEKLDDVKLTSLLHDDVVRLEVAVNDA